MRCLFSTITHSVKQAESIRKVWQREVPTYIVLTTMGPLQCLYFFYRNSESSVNISYLNIRPSQEHIGFPFCFKLAVLCSLGVDKLFEVQSGWLFWVSCSTNSGRGRHCWTRTCGRSKGTCSETTEIYKISTHISFLLRIVRPPTPRGNWRRDQLLTYHRKNKFKVISEI